MVPGAGIATSATAPWLPSREHSGCEKCVQALHSEAGCGMGAWLSVCPILAGGAQLEVGSPEGSLLFSLPCPQAFLSPQRSIGPAAVAFASVGPPGHSCPGPQTALCPGQAAGQGGAACLSLRLYSSDTRPDCQGTGVTCPDPSVASSWTLL